MWCSSASPPSTPRHWPGTGSSSRNRPPATGSPTTCRPARAPGTSGRPPRSPSRCACSSAATPSSHRRPAHDRPTWACCCPSGSRPGSRTATCGCGWSPTSRGSSATTPASPPASWTRCSVTPPLLPTPHPASARRVAGPRRPGRRAARGVPAPHVHHRRRGRHPHRPDTGPGRAARPARRCPASSGSPPSWRCGPRTPRGCTRCCTLTVDRSRLLADFADPDQPGDRRWWEDWDEAVAVGVAGIIPAASLHRPGRRALRHRPRRRRPGRAVRRPGRRRPGRPARPRACPPTASTARPPPRWPPTPRPGGTSCTAHAGDSDRDVSAALTGDPAPARQPARRRPGSPRARLRAGHRAVAGPVGLHRQPGVRRRPRPGARQLGCARRCSPRAPTRPCGSARSRTACCRSPRGRAGRPDDGDPPWRCRWSRRCSRCGPGTPPAPAPAAPPPGRTPTGCSTSSPTRPRRRGVPLPAGLAARAVVARRGQLRPARQPGRQFARAWAARYPLARPAGAQPAAPVRDTRRIPPASASRWCSRRRRGPADLPGCSPRSPTPR